MSQRLRYVLLCLMFLAGGICRGYGQSGSFGQRPRLTGSWGGFRDELAKDGITVTSTFIGDGMADVRGGLQRKTVFTDNWDLGVSLKTDQLLGWQDGLIHFTILQNNGGHPSRYIGDVQAANNIEAVRTLRIYEAWVQQNLFDNRLSLLAGVYDINFEFDYIESASLFVNSSQGIGGAIAASGLVGPPTFPATTPTARIKVIPASSFYAQAAVSDGVPGVKHVSWSPQENDGAFWITEVGLLTQKKNGNSDGFDSRNHISCAVGADYLFKFAIGGWMYSRNFVQQRFGTISPSGQNEKGLYLLFDIRSFSWISPKLKPLTWHVQLGIADNDLSRMRTFWGSGFTYQKLPFDPTGVAGFSVSAVQNSKVYDQQFSGKHPDYEVALEWTYQTAITSWLNFQPDVQQIINPGMVPGVKNALVVALRTEINL